MSAGEALLEARGLGMSFGGVRALESVDFAVGAGEIAALIGPNGAGKTTLFNCVTGLYRPTAGRIVARPPGGSERRVSGLAPHRITALGLARTFQNIRLFPDMTVLENVMVGRHARTRAGALGAILRDRRTREEERGIAAAARALLAETGLADCAGAPAASLPYGRQRRLEIARALAAEPFVLLLDEPAAGMNPRETGDLDELIRAVRDRRGIAVVLIEHDMRLVMGIADRVVVLDAGRLIADGPPAAVRRDPAVVRAYLGEDAGA